jgi:hypothetical protein
LANVSVTDSGGVGVSEFIVQVAPLQTSTVTLPNPSNVSLDTVDNSLPVVLNGVNIGRTALNVKRHFRFLLQKCRAHCYLMNST